MTDAPELVELTDVTKTYAAGEGAQPLRVLEGISLRVSGGASLAVTGPSGSGKSTLLNIIGGLDRATGGQVLLGGRDLMALSDGELALLRSREVGFVFQLHHLLPQCTIWENVLVPTVPLGRAPQAECADRARRLLDHVGLADRLSHRPGQLSGGECQRVAVVRALINRPRLLLADEPTGSLDRSAAENLAELLVELNGEEDIALIVVTHSLWLAGYMSRRCELRDGSLCEDGRS